MSGIQHEILNHLPDAVLLLDSECRVQYANAQAARLTGRSVSELPGTTLWTLWPEFSHTEIERKCREILHGGSSFALAHPSSPIQVLEVRGTALGAGILLIVREAAALQTGREDPQDRLAAIVESSDDAIISKDLNGIIRSWNGGAERIFGYAAGEAIGKHISLIAAPGRAEEISTILARIARGERVDHYQTKRKTKDGRILSVSLTVSPVRDGAGRIVGASKIARDVTEQERYQESLRIANESLSRANADLEQFAYSASHDLQEPLRMVCTYSEMLQRKFGGRLGESADEYIHYIVDGALRMEQLLRDLRAYTQAAKTGEAAPVEVDAAEALRRALANLSSAIQDSQASVTYDALPWVRIHNFQLEQVFQNLIGNAIRYRSQEPPRIHVAAEKSAAEWRFSVQDNGIGIDPQYKEQIFGIFKRLHSAADYPGTGMGLAICQRVVERAGGRIWVESQPGRGATFFFTLPAR